MIGKNVTVIIDRPLGSAHPSYPDLIYTVNYGYVEGIIAGDREEQDVYILGIDTPVEVFRGKVIAIIHRRDDVEDKWVVAPDGFVADADAIRESTYFQEKYFDIEIIMK